MVVGTEAGTAKYEYRAHGTALMTGREKGELDEPSDAGRGSPLQMKLPVLMFPPGQCGRAPTGYKPSLQLMGQNEPTAKIAPVSQEASACTLDGRKPLGTMQGATNTHTDTHG